MSKRRDGSPEEKHGKSNTPEYRTWKQMRERCESPGHPRYSRYGGRGITICERWQSFLLFLEDVGTRPGPEYDLDRIDDKAGYCKENCRWLHRRENSRRRECVKLTMEKAEEIRAKRILGQTQVSIAKEYGVSISAVRKVIRNEIWRKE